MSVGLEVSKSVSAKTISLAELVDEVDAVISEKKPTIGIQLNVGFCVIAAALHGLTAKEIEEILPDLAQQVTRVAKDVISTKGGVRVGALN